MVLMVPVMMIFSANVRGRETVGYGSCDDGSVVRGCETVGCMYGWWYDGWFSGFL